VFDSATGDVEDEVEECDSAWTGSATIVTSSRSRAGVAADVKPHIGSDTGSGAFAISPESQWPSVFPTQQGIVDC
jgi:hypothetical protein